jgi:hypothetical protein
MTGTRSILHPWGGPWAGGASEAFEQSDVRAFGKLSRWGDARIHYLVRLVDGAELFVLASKQPPADEKWLQRLGTMVETPQQVTRDCGWAIVWQEISPSPG